MGTNPEGVGAPTCDFGGAWLGAEEPPLPDDNAALAQASDAMEPLQFGATSHPPSAWAGATGLAMVPPGPGTPEAAVACPSGISIAVCPALQVLAASNAPHDSVSLFSLPTLTPLRTLGRQKWHTEGVQGPGVLDIRLRKQVAAGGVAFTVPGVTTPVERGPGSDWSESAVGPRPLLLVADYGNDRFVQALCTCRGGLCGGEHACGAVCAVYAVRTV